MANNYFGKWVESQARSLREKAQIGPFARLDPILLASKMSIAVRSVDSFSGEIGDTFFSAIGEHRDCWDAGTLVFPDGLTLIIFNPTRDPRRRTATLMEELAHVHLGHKPSELQRIGGLVIRTCCNSNEKQAYAVGAAALLPAYLLKGAQTRGFSRAEVIEEHGISPELLRYRENVTGVKLETDGSLSAI